MSTLNWLRESDHEPLNNGQILRREKKLLLEGDHYTAPPPQGFWVLRRPCPAIEAILSWTHSDRWREYAHRDVSVFSDQPWITVRSTRTVEIGNVGFAHTHRWVFTDGADWSYVIRLARLATVRARSGLGGGANVGAAKAEGSIGIEGQINVGVDPTITVDLVTPWSNNLHKLTIEGIMRAEVLALVDESGRGEPPDWSKLMGTLQEVSPEFVLDHQPDGIRAAWEPARFTLDAGETAYFTMGFDVYDESKFIFPFCFVVQDDEVVIDISDVMFVSSTGKGDIRIDFMEGF